ITFPISSRRHLKSERNWSHCCCVSAVVDIRAGSCERVVCVIPSPRLCGERARVRGFSSHLFFCPVGPTTDNMLSSAQFTIAPVNAQTNGFENSVATGFPTQAGQDKMPESFFEPINLSQKKLRAFDRLPLLSAGRIQNSK